jgi:hypothetical protein
VHTLALANLSRAFPEPFALSPTDTPGLDKLASDDPYAAARLLLHDRWEPLNARLSGGLVACTPARDLVLVTGADDADALAAMRREAATRPPRRPTRSRPSSCAGLLPAGKCRGRADFDGLVPSLGREPFSPRRHYVSRDEASVRLDGNPCSSSAPAAEALASAGAGRSLTRRKATTSERPVGHETDEELVAGALGGERACFDQLVMRHGRSLCRFVAAYLGRRTAHLAEDVTQDAFVAAYTSLSSFRGKSTNQDVALRRGAKHLPSRAAA